MTWSAYSVFHGKFYVAGFDNWKEETIHSYKISSLELWYNLKLNYVSFILQVRKLEFLITFLVLTIAVCFFMELGYAKPVATEVLHGLFVPQLKGNGATGLAISLLGAMVMP